MHRPARLTGRAAEREALGRLVRPGTAGVPVVLVAGEAGVGKTTLVEHALADARVAVLRGRAGEWQTAAYDVLAQALRPALATADGPLAAVLPGLGVPAGAVDAPAVAAAVCALLAGLPGGAPVVLLLDDLHWADEATLDLLPPLAEAAAASRRIVVVGCYRSDEMPRHHRLRPVRAELRRRHRLAELTLSPLGPDEVRHMLADLLGAPPDDRLHEAIAERAEGVPFAVEELAAALHDSGRLTRDGTTVGLSSGGETLVPDGVREAVLLRTTPLPAGARAVLDAAAVVGTTFDVQDALAAAGEACWPEQLAGRGLVTAVDNGRAAFRHALTRDAVYTEIAWSQRRALHRAVAERLAAGRAPALAAAHLLAAGEPDRARPALVTAAGDYIAVHAYRDAARVLRCALELWPSGAAAATGRLDVVERLASCATMCADHAEAVTLLRELVDGRRQGGETVALAAALRRLALAHELLGHWDAALEHHEAAAVAFSDGGLRAEAALERLAAAVHLRAAASYSAALDSVEAARADAAAAGAGELRLRLDGLRGNVLARHGQVEEGVAAVRAALDEALAAGLPGPAAELHQRLADALEHAGDYPGAVATYAAGYRYCDTHGQDATGALCRACVTVVLFSSGRWDEAAEVCRDVLEELGGAHSHAVTAGILGLVHAMRGEAELARPHLLHGRALATRIELAAVELLCTWGLAVLADQSGAHDEAADHGRRVLERWDGTQEAHYVVPVLQWTATLFAESGLAVETRRCAAALSRVAEAAARPEALAALAHALGETALLEGSPRAVDELTRAVDLLADRDLPLATALARRRAAAALAAHGQRDRAAALLRAAHDTGRLLRAAPFTARVTADLRALGETAPRGDAGRDAGRGTGLGAGLNAGPGRPAGPAGAAGLSRRELEVLRLVARGRTSRAIAGELFLSPRTVEMHVTNGMRKLACRTRAEAVRRLTELSLIGGPTTS